MENPATRARPMSPRTLAAMALFDMPTEVRETPAPAPEPEELKRESPKRECLSGGITKAGGIAPKQIGQKRGPRGPYKPRKPKVQPIDPRSVINLESNLPQMHLQSTSSGSTWQAPVPVHPTASFYTPQAMPVPHREEPQAPPQAPAPAPPLYHPPNHSMPQPFSAAAAYTAPPAFLGGPPAMMHPHQSIAPALAPPLPVMNRVSLMASFLPTMPTLAL